MRKTGSNQRPKGGSKKSNVTDYFQSSYPVGERRPFTLLAIEFLTTCLAKSVVYCECSLHHTYVILTSDYIFFILSLTYVQIYLYHRIYLPYNSPIKMYNLMIFRIFRFVVDCHCNYFRTFSSPQKATEISHISPMAWVSSSLRSVVHIQQCPMNVC